MRRRSLFLPDDGSRYIRPKVAALTPTETNMTIKGSVVESFLTDFSEFQPITAKGIKADQKGALGPLGMTGQ